MSDLQPTAVMRGASARNGDSVPSVEPYRPSTWVIFFVQDCNLRCGYCCTGYGRFGRKSKVMQPEVWRRLSDLILGMRGDQGRIRVEFGGGETFLHFEEAMLFLDHLRHLAEGKGIRVEAQITTNGTLATAEQLQTCLEKRISLCFSIDGPASKHDAFRRFPDGKPTHRIALKNWRRYQDLIGSVPDAPESEVASVIAGGARLQDLVRFWRKQGVTRFRVVPAEPSRYMGVRRLEEWESRRKQYLEDLKVLAFSETTRLRGRDLQKEFEGPTAILSSWSRLSRAEPYRVCGAGYTYIAVDSDGALFPCQGFVGFAARSIGDVRSSVLPAKLAEFRSARLRVQSACNGCWARFLCEGGCCAGDPEAGVVLNTWKGCEFTKAHVEIAVQSYYNWCGHGVESGDEKGKTRTSA